MVENKYSLKEAASCAGIPARRLKFYIDEGVFVPDEVSTGRGVGNRFSERNIVELHIIKKLASLGLKLSFIGDVMDILNGAGSTSCADAVL